MPMECRMGKWRMSREKNCVIINCLEWSFSFFQHHQSAYSFAIRVDMILFLTPATPATWQMNGHQKTLFPYAKCDALHHLRFEFLYLGRAMWHWPNGWTERANCMSSSTLVHLSHRWPSTHTTLQLVTFVFCVRRKRVFYCFWLWALLVLPTPWIYVLCAQRWRWMIASHDIA